MARSRRAGPRRPVHRDEATRHVEDAAVNDLLAPVVAESGAFLEAVAVRRAGAKTLVRVTVDLPEEAIGAMSLDEVAVVSRAISQTLDDADLIPGTYTLEVSTPGTSRPLTELRHFKRARTRLVRLALRDGQSVVGRLVAVSGDRLTLVDEANGGRSEVPLAEVAKGRVEVELSRAAEADLGDENTAQEA